ncbi:ribonuclease P 40kDa subunit-domain-containing protein [Rhodofomes roseus]|uniref:Ribonuclease P 40kDa subunit-domain-containing protein n=1 Tax=Rhodofomes roseus TaxID=34475 RepID=A0ABQ8K691_9APHY|nr:ribonuclease P 40kDa subunit-domain-containing protein [Rhodofomes roseus]KAH9832613.1 ribonuclease P 40kDa subunit-domain-containing protein [Rhodofomes roseus]
MTVARASTRSWTVPPTHFLNRHVDMVFPSELMLQGELASLTSTYWSCRSTITKFIDYAKTFVNKLEMQSDIAAVSLFDPATDAGFSLDTRGVLTFVVDKTAYERLGLAGTQMRWSGCDDMYLIQCTLSEGVPDDPATRKLHQYGPKQQAAITQWDADHGLWNISYYLRDAGPNSIPIGGSTEHVVRPSISRRAHVHVPEPTLCSCPNSEEEREDWDEEISALFEWVGMSCLGSQRLLASDSCDPYIAMYASPSPSHVTDTVHIRWRGLLSPAFTRSIVGSMLKACLPRPAFAAVTIHGMPTAPVTYIPPSSSLRTPMRLPRPESEDTWSLLVSSHGDAQRGTSNWVLAESIGKWDSRWG